MLTKAQKKARAKKRRGVKAREKYWGDVELSRTRLRDCAKRHKESRKIYRKGYVQSNREKVRAYNISYLREYSKKNRKALSAKQLQLYHSDIQVRLRMNLRTRLGQAIRKNRAGSAVRDLGCSIAELRLYLESKFTIGMSWDNYGFWHIDHIQPLSSFDLTNREQFLTACNYRNLQPLWAVDNLKKSNKSITCNS